MKNRILLFLVLAIFMGCQPSPSHESGKKVVVTTTNIIADAARELLKADAEVVSLMGPGVDPHLYKASQGDLDRLYKADIVLYHGLHLEGKMSDVLEKFGRQKPVFAIAEDLEITYQTYEINGTTVMDPHIWFNIQHWVTAVKKMEEALSLQMPELKDSIARRSEDFQKRLLATHELALEEVSTLPESKRILVTAHDAFGYFGEAYGFEVVGLQGISTASEFGLRDVTNLVDFIIENQLSAIFIESSISPKTLESVVEGCKRKGHEITIGGQLYSDALGAQNAKEGTLIGAFQHNLSTIITALE